MLPHTGKRSYKQAFKYPYSQSMRGGAAFKRVPSQFSKTVSSYTPAQRSMYRKSQIVSHGRPEVKFVDYNSQGSRTNVSVTLAEAPLQYALRTTNSLTSAINGVAQGTGVNQRIGRKINMLSMNFRALVSYDVKDNGTGPCAFRLIVYMDTQNNSLDPDEDISPLAPVSASYGAHLPLQFNDLSYSKRYKILHNEIFTTVVNDSTAFKFIEKNYRFKTPVSVNYTGDDISAGSIADNAIYVKLFFVSSYGGVLDETVTNHINVNWNSCTRIRYTDQ